jgi:hypothetical protein
VFLGWQYAERVYLRFRDSAPLEGMYKHFTVSLNNLKEGRMYGNPFIHVTTGFDTCILNWPQMDSRHFVLLPTRLFEPRHQPSRFLLYGTPCPRIARHRVFCRSLLFRRKEKKIRFTLSHRLVGSHWWSLGEKGITSSIASLLWRRYIDRTPVRPGLDPSEAGQVSISLSIPRTSVLCSHVT